MYKVIVGGLIALCGMSAAAQAGDLHDGAGSLKDAPIISVAPRWAGLYVGGSAGFGVGRSQVDIIDNDDGEVFPFDYETNGAVYGGHIGYNIQRDHLVFGVEVTGSQTDIVGGFTFFDETGTSLDWYATVAARLGYASGNTLLYGFGGAAWGDLRSFFGDLDATDTVTGWTAGLGVEHALSERLSVRVEYAHVDLEEGYNTNPDFLFSTETEMKFDTIKIGASLKLGGR